jgi:hypothetical protein
MQERPAQESFQCVGRWRVFQSLLQELLTVYLRQPSGVGKFLDSQATMIDRQEKKLLNTSSRLQLLPSRAEHVAPFGHPLARIFRHAVNSSCPIQCHPLEIDSPLDMSGVAENILCGIVVEVLKTCFVYGNKWIQNYRNADDYKEEDGEAMKEVVNKLLDIQDFYVEFWPHIPNRDRILLGKCLNRIHTILCNGSTQDGFSVIVGNETIMASSPADIYQQLSQYGAAVEVLEIPSTDNSTFAEGFWERMKKDVTRVSDKLAYTFVGRDRHCKLIRIVGEWINNIDDLIGFRSNQLMLRGIIGSQLLTRMAQRSNLPNTSNRIGLLLTNTTPPPNVEHDVTLNPEVTTFNRNTITMTDNSRINPASSAASPGLGGSRNWATFSPQPPTTADSPGQKVIIEFKPISQTNAPIYNDDANTRALSEVRSLVRALHIAAREPDKLHVLDCLRVI